MTLNKEKNNNKMVVKIIPHPYPCKSCVYLPLGRQGSSETHALGFKLPLRAVANTHFRKKYNCIPSTKYIYIHTLYLL
jgi:hypothetical protein